MCTNTFLCKIVHCLVLLDLFEKGNLQSVVVLRRIVASLFILEAFPGVVVREKVEKINKTLIKYARDG